jgi:hypothetical protein
MITHRSLGETRYIRLSCTAGGPRSENEALGRQPTSASDSSNVGAGYSPTFPQAQDLSVFPPASHDMMFLDDLLSSEERKTRYAVREFMVSSSAHP